MTDKILMSAVDSELAKKGLTKIDGDPAELYVIYQLAVVETAERSSFSTDVRWQGGPDSLGGFPGAGSNSTPLIRVGWLIQDIYDIKQKKAGLGSDGHQDTGKQQRSEADGAKYQEGDGKGL